MRKFSRLIATCVAGPMLVLAALPAAAQQITVRSGKVTGVDTAATNNYPFRVRLTNSTGANALSDCAETMAYANSQEGNYDATVMAIMTAYIRGTNVLLYTTKDSSGFCHIEYFGS